MGELFTIKKGAAMKERIRQIRSDHHLTQSAFGKCIGVKGNTITNYENGLRTPNGAVILSICREFSVNEDWLCNGNGEPYKYNNSFAWSTASGRIKYVRNSQNLTQVEFGQKIGIKDSTISSYENGTRIPSDAIILAICREFQVNEKWLRNGVGDPYKSQTASERIAVFMDRVLAADDSFKFRLITALSELSEDEWISLESILIKISQK